MTGILAGVGSTSHYYCNSFVNVCGMDSANRMSLGVRATLLLLSCYSITIYQMSCMLDQIEQRLYAEHLHANAVPLFHAMQDQPHMTSQESCSSGIQSLIPASTIITTFWHQLALAFRNLATLIHHSSPALSD